MCHLLSTVIQSRAAFNLVHRSKKKKNAIQVEKVATPQGDSRKRIPETATEVAKSAQDSAPIGGLEPGGLVGAVVQLPSTRFRA